MAQNPSYSPASLMEELEQSDETEVEPMAQRSTVSKRGLFATLGLAVVGAVVLAHGGSARKSLTPTDARLDAATMLVESADPCEKYPFIRLDKLVSSNMGSHGPDKDKEEGIVYEATDIIPGKDPLSLSIVVNNVDGKYEVAHASQNGIYGKYGLITMKAGTTAKFTLKVLDTATKAPKKLAKQEITFFDLDQGQDGGNKESIELCAFSDTWLTKNTEVAVKDLGNGCRSFTSTEFGHGRDNPKDPTSLTVQQKNRAVTTEYKDFSEITFTLSAGGGKYTRYFMFVLRPSLLCAKTEGKVEAGEDEVVSIDKGKAKDEQGDGCIFVFPIVNYCLKKFW